MDIKQEDSLSSILCEVIPHVFLSWLSFMLNCWPTLSGAEGCLMFLLLTYLNLESLFIFVQVMTWPKTVKIICKWLTKKSCLNLARNFWYGANYLNLHFCGIFTYPSHIHPFSYFLFNCWTVNTDSWIPRVMIFLCNNLL